jgi:xanthine dehydrogenase accessory factor
MPIATDAAHFVGSRRKMDSLRDRLIADGIDSMLLDKVKAPAGLGAITPEEIAMSILAEITLERRRGQRG